MQPSLLLKPCIFCGKLVEASKHTPYFRVECDRCKKEKQEYYNERRAESDRRKERQTQKKT